MLDALIRALEIFLFISLMIPVSGDAMEKKFVELENSLKKEKEAREAAEQEAKEVKENVRTLMPPQCLA